MGSWAWFSRVKGGWMDERGDQETEDRQTDMVGGRGCGDSHKEMGIYKRYKRSWRQGDRGDQKEREKTS